MSYYVATARRRRPHSNLASLLIITSRRHINILEVARSILKVFLKEMAKLRFHYQISFEKYVSAYVHTMLFLYSTSKLALPTTAALQG
jgi:hypothetical protein